MAGKILTWRENSAASQSKRAWNAPWNAPSPPRIFSCRHDNVITTRDKNEHSKKDCDCCVRLAQHLYEKDDLYGTDNNDSDDSCNDDNDGRIRLGVLILRLVK